MEVGTVLFVVLTFLVIYPCHNCSVHSFASTLRRRELGGGGVVDLRNGKIQETNKVSSGKGKYK